MCLKRLGLCMTAVVAGALVFQATAGAIILRPEVQYQTIVGFGGHDPRNQVNLLVNDLGMSAHRDEIQCAVGGNSAVGWAKLTELKNAGVQVFIANPWSPPPQYKWNNNCSGTDGLWNRVSNGLGPRNDYLHPTADPEKGGLPNYYPQVAAWLSQYAGNFRSNVGIDLYAISPQNELAFAQPYPSCVYSVYQFRDMVWELGKKLATDGRSQVRIYGAEDMLTSFTANGFIQCVYSDTATRKYFDVASVHGYSNGISPAPTSSLASSWGGSRSVGTFAYTRGLGMWQTEISGYLNWAGGQGPDGACAGAQDLGTAMFASLKYGKISAWFWWRLAVTEDYWIDEALVYNGQPLKTYYVSKNFYKYIRPGSVMIHVNDSADADLGCIAFWHKTNQTLTMVYANSGASSKSVTITGTLPASMNMYVTSATQDFANTGTVTSSTFNIPASSFVTLHGTNYNPPVSAFNHIERGRFTVGALGEGTIAHIFAMDGSLVRTIRNPRIVNGERLAWDGCDDNGVKLARGSYYASLSDRAGTPVSMRVAVGSY